MVVIRDAIFVTALINAAAYAKWHFWWRSGFGRSRMCLLLSLAALTAEPALRHWTGVAQGSTADHILDGIEYAAPAGVLISLLYMLCRIVRKNIQRVRNPARADEEGRRHLRQTPWATEAEIEKLLTTWNESRSRQQHGLLSRT